MKLLIDTNVFLWTAFEPRRLSARAREALADTDNELVVSVVIPLELGMAANKGRVSLGRPVAGFYVEQLEALGPATELPIAREHALAAAELPYSNRDPMDRILAAQSIVEGIALVTSDRRIAELGVEVVW